MTPTDTLIADAEIAVIGLRGMDQPWLAEVADRLLARVRELESGLTWTDAKPTVPGWYWYRDDLDDHRDSWGMFKYPGGETIFDEGFSHPLEEFAGQFAGPIPTPKEKPCTT